MIKQERVFTELTREVDYSAQLYALGKEVKEIASLKFRAISTVNNQIKKAFEVLGVRNGRELSILYAQRVTKMIIMIFFLSLVVIDFVSETSSIYRGSKKLEVTVRNRKIKRTNEYEPLILFA